MPFIGLLFTKRKCCVMTYFCIFQEKPHKPAKVDKWDASATKNALDDAVKKVA